MTISLKEENEKLKTLLEKSVSIIKRLDNGKKKEKIAIVGMSCRFPNDCYTIEKYWQLLKEGVIVNNNYPETREFETGLSLSYPASYLESIAKFDPLFFGISPKEAEDMDPQQRILLELVWEAAEQAGYNAKQLDKDTTVYIGCIGSDFNQILNKHQHSNSYTLTGTLSSILSGRIAFTMGYEGEAITIDTACSSSLVALNLACNSLLNRKCKFSLVGAANLILEEYVYNQLNNIKALASDGYCKTLSAKADGYGRAEGCAMLLLKRLDEAIKDNDNILAVIESIQTNHDGHSSGLTVPNGLAQKKLIQSVLKNSGLTPSQIVYYEMHGTGTPLGDPIEFKAIQESIFENPHEREIPLYIGSSKTNLGHSEACAGLAGVIKAVLMLKNNCIVPYSLSLQAINPRIRLTPEIAIADRAIAVDMKNKAIAINSFGFSGTNAAVIISNYNINPNLIEKNECKYLFSLSSNREVSLINYIKKYIAAIEDDNGLNIVQICHTTNISRSFDKYRVNFEIHSKKDLLTKLNEVLEKPNLILKVSPNKLGIIDELIINAINNISGIKHDFPVIYEEVISLLSENQALAPSKLIYKYLVAGLTLVKILQSIFINSTWCYSGLSCILPFYLLNRSKNINFSKLINIVNFENLTPELLAQVLDKPNKIGADLFYSVIDFQLIPVDNKNILEIDSNYPVCADWISHIIYKLLNAGESINWEYYYKNKNYIKTTLPTYAFEQDIFWPKLIKTQKQDAISCTTLLDMPSDIQYYDITKAIFNYESIQATHNVVHIGIYIDLLLITLGGDRKFHISNMIFFCPIIFKKNIDKKVIIRITSYGSQYIWAFLSKLHSDTIWTKHVEGKIEYRVAFENDLTCPGKRKYKTLSGDSFYNYLNKSLDLSLGDKVKKIIKIDVIEEKQFLVHIKSESIAENLLPFSSEVLDCCAQAFHMHSYCVNEKVKYMVASMEEIVFFNSKTNLTDIKCLIDIVDKTEDELIGNLNLFDSDNLIIAKITGCFMKKVTLDLSKITLENIPISHKFKDPSEFEKYLIDTFCALLGIKHKDVIDMKLPMTNYGLDSISALILKEKLDPWLSNKLDIIDLTNDISIESILKRVDQSSFDLEGNKSEIHSHSTRTEIHQWIKNIRISPEAKCVLYAIPYGGAGASVFNNLIKHLPSWIHLSPIQLPGREDRKNENLYTDIQLFNSCLPELIQNHTELPFLFYGHSFGALIAFRLMLHFNTIEQALGVIVAACSAPGLQENPWLKKIKQKILEKIGLDLVTIRSLKCLDRKQISVLLSIFQMDNLKLNEGEAQYFLKILLADLCVVDSYPKHIDKISKPILALHGLKDDRVDKLEVDAWSHLTTSLMQLNEYNGDHFFIRNGDIAYSIASDISIFAQQALKEIEILIN
ncbi:beta-ketoacyl synthase N-terminal-like domain-containing protein [Rickettsiella endosymbiont of Dermanyssus gallinae]|uniref:beta-ketoacyl synthase N-terminal-like domain-containing protein n=1 Tax=Rickettsiella endosymbiont of Dermanyssus gallinae TaxID=2856608 RepID=UPI001C530B34|nr:beta-ketoacyl synthase N-terminal-like domain-containing protein [Rickettsiella endosymbiont of Dermanyssus gallinae]